jgi:hypothetical protein
VLPKIMTWVWLAVVTTLQLAAQPPGSGEPVPTGFQINGMLVDANTGQPIRRARVAIASVTERDNFTTIMTREDGRFSFINVAAGKYTLTAQARGYLLQSFNQHDQFSSSVVVGPNLESTDLLFRLPPDGAISGVVVDEAGEPVRDAQVLLYVTGPSGGFQTTRSRNRTATNDEGAYHFGHLAPGRYLVAAAARPWYAQNRPARGAAQDTIVSDPSSEAQLDVAYPVTFSGGATDEAEAAPIVLGRGNKVTADIILQPVPALHVRLPRDDSDQSGFTSVELSLFGAGIGNRVGGFSQNTEESVSLAPGRYSLRHFPPNGKGIADTLREVDINSSGEIDKSQGNVNVPVSAKLQFDPGTAPDQVFLELLNKKSRQSFSARMAKDGEAVFQPDLAPGSYEISLNTGSGIYVKSISASGATVTGRTVEIRPGSPVKLAVSAATGEGEVKGTALRGGKPFGGAMVVLVPADPSHNQVLFRRDQSDTDGTFTLAAVVPGAYTLLAIENGWELEWMKPEVLKNYLGAGAAIQVRANGKYDIKVELQ